MWREIQTSHSDISSSSVNIVRADARDKHQRIGYNGLPRHFVSFVREWKRGDSFEIAANNQSDLIFNGLQTRDKLRDRLSDTVAIIPRWKISVLAGRLGSPLNPFNVISYGLFSSSFLLSNLRISQPRDLPLPRPSHFLNSLVETLEKCISRDGEQPFLSPFFLPVL